MNTNRHICGFEAYRPADVHQRCRRSRHITHITSPDASDTEKALILEVVEKEQPIHFKLLCRRIASLYTRNEKNNSALYWKVASIITARNLLGNKLIMYMNYVCTRDYDKVAVRYRTDDKLTERQISQICPEELMQAIRLVLLSKGIMTKDALMNIVRDELGYFVMGTDIQTRLNKCIEIMQHNGDVEINDKSVKLTAKGRKHEYRMGEFSKVKVLEIPSIEKASMVKDDVFCVDEDLWFDNIVIDLPKEQKSNEKGKQPAIKRLSCLVNKKKQKEPGSKKSSHSNVVVQTTQNRDTKEIDCILGKKSCTVIPLPDRIHDLSSTSSGIPEQENICNTKNENNHREEVLNSEALEMPVVPLKGFGYDSNKARQYVEWPYWYGSLLDAAFSKSASSLKGMSCIELLFTQGYAVIEASVGSFLFVPETGKLEDYSEGTQHLVTNEKSLDVSCYRLVDVTEPCISANPIFDAAAVYTDIMHIHLESQKENISGNVDAEAYASSKTVESFGKTCIKHILNVIWGPSPRIIQISDNIYKTIDTVRNKYFPSPTHQQGEVPYSLAVLVAAFPVPGLARIITAQYISGIAQMLLCLFVWKWCYLWWAFDFYRILTRNFVDSEGNELKNYNKWYTAAGFIIYSFLLSMLMPTFLRW